MKLRDEKKDTVATIVGGTVMATFFTGILASWPISAAVLALGTFALARTLRGA